MKLEVDLRRKDGIGTAAVCDRRRVVLLGAMPHLAYPCPALFPVKGWMERDKSCPLVRLVVADGSRVGKLV